jgi:RNA-directed DNA polymerase
MGEHDHWSGDKSRMRRESHVRFREGLGVQFPRATRLVICCRHTAAEAMGRMRAMMAKLKLTVNETKTRAGRVPEETFDFVGYRFGRIDDRRTGRSYTGAQPSPKEVRRLCREISDLTRRTTYPLSEAEQVGRLNRVLRGWWNYFSRGTVGRAYQVVNNRAEGRLRRWLCEKHKEPRPGYTRYPSRYPYQELGLVGLRKLVRATGP